MTIPAGTLPVKLLALDDMLWQGLSYEEQRRLRDRIGLHRSELLIVLVVDTPSSTDSMEGDYLVGRQGAWMLRLPAQEEVTNAPQGSLSDAVRHLADAFLIMPSSVGVFLETHLTRQAPDPAWLIERLRRGDGESLIAAIDRFLNLPPAASSADFCDEGLARAIDSLRRNVTPLGFTAASLGDNQLGLEDANYASIWARDGAITGLWSMSLDDSEFIDAFGATLRLLARHQAPSGQIPAYVLIDGERPDYSGIGGIASIDSVLWFVIGAVRYAFFVGDRDFAVELLPAIERAMAWLSAHDSNNDGLLEIP